MKLDKELLHDDSDDVVGNFNSCLNARGLYDSMQFVLRLRPDIHHLLEGYEDSIIDARYLDNDTIQAFSTYFHETIHWLQQYLFDLLGIKILIFHGVIKRKKTS